MKKPSIGVIAHVAFVFDCIYKPANPYEVDDEMTVCHCIAIMARHDICGFSRCQHLKMVMLKERSASLHWGRYVGVFWQYFRPNLM